MLQSFRSMGVLALVVAIGAVGAQPARPAADSRAEAEAVLERVADTMAAAQSLSVEYEVYHGDETARSGWYNTGRLMKPNRIWLDVRMRSRKDAAEPWTTTPSAILSARGDERLSYGVRRNQYRREKLDPQGKRLNLVDIMPFVDFFDRRRSFLEQVRRAREEGRERSLALLPDEEWQGHQYRVVEWEAASEIPYPEETLARIPGGVMWNRQRLYVGEDHVIHRIVERSPLRQTMDRRVLKVTLNDPAVTAASFEWSLPAGAEPQPAPPPLLAAGTDAPDFEGLLPGDAGPARLSSLRGKVVIVDFWATWCLPCQKAMPHLAEVYRATRAKNEDVVLLAVCVWDDRPAFESWVRKNQERYPFRFVFDPAARNSEASIARKLYNVHGIPTTYVIDRAGKVVAGFVGDEDEDAKEDPLKAALTKVGISL